jgi:hypothetical protein
MTYLGRPYIWSDKFAWLYGYAVPNGNGELAVIAYFGGGKYFPSIGLGFAENEKAFNSQSSTNKGPKFWSMAPLILGKNGPSSDRWADYIRLREIGGSSSLWVGSGFVFEKGNLPKNIKPYIFIFGKN